MNRWSFNLQIYFLNKRFKEVVEISQSNDTIIQDRTIYEDACIFAPTSMTKGICRTEILRRTATFFNLMMSLVKKPQLMIYIRSSIPTLVRHIEKRGRDYEKSIRIDYLTGLQKRYDNWMSSYDGEVITIDGDKIHFEESKEDFRKITDMIDASLYGLFPIGSNNK